MVAARGGEREGGDNDNKDGDNGGPGGRGGRGGRPHPLEKKFLRTLVVVDAPVLDEDRNDGGDGGGSDVGRGNSGDRNGTKKELPSLYNAWLPAGKAQAVVKEEENHGVMPGGGTVRRGVQIRKGH